MTPMILKMLRAGLVGCAAVIATVPAVAAQAPSIIEAMFEKPHLDGLAAGTTLTYDFERNASEPRLLGPNFEDSISVGIKEVAEDATRTVVVSVFTGDRSRDDRTISGLTGNPVLVFFLDRAVANFSLLAGGNRAYHKNRFRIAMRTEGGLQPVTFQYEGKTVEGYRLAIRPFTGDRKNVDKMKGYEKAQFEFIMSAEVPGYFAGFRAHYSSPNEGSPTLEETIVLNGATLPQALETSAAEADAKSPAGEKKSEAQ